jgi:hypothetical protein
MNGAAASGKRGGISLPISNRNVRKTSVVHGGHPDHRDLDRARHPCPAYGPHTARSPLSRLVTRSLGASRPRIEDGYALFRG